MVLSHSMRGPGEASLDSAERTEEKDTTSDPDSLRTYLAVCSVSIGNRKIYRFRRMDSRVSLEDSDHSAKPKIGCTLQARPCGLQHSIAETRPHSETRRIRHIASKQLASTAIPL